MAVGWTALPKSGISLYEEYVSGLSIGKSPESV